MHSNQSQASPEALIEGIDERIEKVFKSQAGQAFTPNRVRPSLAGGRPYFARGFSWSIVGFAGRCLYLGEMLPKANEALQLNAKFYLRQLDESQRKAILPAGKKEGNTRPYSRIVDRDSMHWHADIVLRLIEMYGTKGTVAAGRITPETEALCLEAIWHYVRLVSRMDKTEFEKSKTWHLWESENHHAQSFSVAWHFSKLAKDLPAFQNRTYDDDSTPAQLYEAWNAYFVEYVRERFRKGIFVEMRSDGYNGESIRGIYNFFDFGNEEVRKHAGMYLDLFWAYWAQEQFNNVSGGGKTRFAFHGHFAAGSGGVQGYMARVYFGLGDLPDSVSGTCLNALLSSYRPPAVVADIATDIAGRGAYEVRQAAQGLGQPAQTNWNQSRKMRPYRLSTDGGGILRYTYCHPAFIMGTPMTEARPLNDWTAISSQNRWQGVIFSGPARDARITLSVLPANEAEARNQFWSVQSKGSIITQMLKSNRGAERMWAWISKAGISDPIEEEGIVFLETDADDGAYAAIRTVGTDYKLMEDYKFKRIRRPPPAHWIVQPNDKFKPVILEVMAKAQVADFAAFKSLVKKNKPIIKEGLVTYKTVYGDVLTLDTNYQETPTINGKSVDYTPDKSYDSPFLHGSYNGTRFVIEKGERRKVFNIPAAK